MVINIRDPPTQYPLRLVYTKKPPETVPKTNPAQNLSPRTFLRRAWVSA
jgi:hypothetical protein